MDDYLMRAEGVLGDEHSFVRLVDTMPQIRFCDFMPEEPEDRDEVEPWDEIQICHRAGVWEYSGSAFGLSSALFCDEHRPEGVPVGHLDASGNKRDGLLQTGWVEPITAPGDQRIVDAARVSIAGEDVRPTSDDKKLIHYLVKNRHTTPLEQVRFTFHCRIPIFVARQWIRHRTGSFNEQSGRYGQLASDFYVPTLERLRLGGQAAKNKQGSGRELSEDIAGATFLAIENAGLEGYRRYEQLLANGVARELARMVLPVNIYTQWFWTTDLHNLMHFLTLRLHSHAQWEFRQYAEAIVPMARAVAPYAMDAFEEHRERWAKAMKL
jgi:thymidylate synthase (FAD)